MFKKIINTVLLASLLCFAFCGKNKSKELPPGILTKEELTKVLVDFALAESAATMNIRNVPLYQLDSTYAFNPLKENNITKASYDSTLAFYSAHADLYKEVYADVLTELSAMQTRRDSLKNLAAAKKP